MLVVAYFFWVKFIFFYFFLFYFFFKIESNEIYFCDFDDVFQKMIISLDFNLRKFFNVFQKMKISLDFNLRKFFTFMLKKETYFQYLEKIKSRIEFFSKKDISNRKKFKICCFDNNSIICFSNIKISNSIFYFFHNLKKNCKNSSRKYKIDIKIKF
jgi:hypothetical protein